MRVALLLVACMLPATALAAPLDDITPRSARLAAAHVIDGTLAGSARPWQAFDSWSMNAADLDGDGRAELVSLNDNGRLYVVDAGTGRVLAEETTLHAGNATEWRTQELNGVAIGDVDGDDDADLAVLNSGGGLTLFEASPTGLDRRWSLIAAAPLFDPAIASTHPWLAGRDPLAEPWLAHGPPFIARVDGPDEPATLFVQSDGFPGAFAFRADGTLRWMAVTDDGHAGPWVGPLVAGGPPVALFATDAGAVVARDAATGLELWRFDARAAGAWPGSFAVAPVVEDLDGDGASEIFVAARVAVEDAADPDWMRRQTARLFLLDAAGGVRWSSAIPDGNPLVHARAVAWDANDDGTRDLVVLDWNTIGHRPGAWERLGPGRLAALDGRTGSAIWTADVDAPFTRFNVPLAEFEPGRVGALVPDARDGAPGLAIVDARTGAHGAWAPLPAGWNATRGAALVDADADGAVEAVVPVARPATGCPPRDDPCLDGALVVYRTGAPAASVVSANTDTFSSEPPRRRLAVASSPAPDPPPARAALAEGAVAPASVDAGAAAEPPLAGAARPGDPGERAPSVEAGAVAAMAAVATIGRVWWRARRA